MYLPADPALFLLTRPLRDVTAYHDDTQIIKLFLLTRPLRDVTLESSDCRRPEKISTHTPLTGRDNFLWHLLLIVLISTHTPLTGRDGDIICLLILNLISTHTPLTGRDENPLSQNCNTSNFYSHAPYGTWRLLNAAHRHRGIFLLTRPLRDVTHNVWNVYVFQLFLLTRPLRDVTLFTFFLDALLQISTHTPLTGRDFSESSVHSIMFNFYSHAPYGTWHANG